MELQKIVIVDPTEEFPDELIRALGNAFQITLCPRGDRALDLILEQKPDLVITELLLEGLDGIGLLRALADSPEKPQVLVASHLLTPYVLGMLEELEVQYAIKKPCDLRAVVERVRELADMARFRPGLKIACRQDTTQMLMELGMPNDRVGFQHLLIGLPLLVSRRDQRMGKELYDSIARHNGGNFRSVEKAIRDAIHEAWDSGDRTAWRSYFPNYDRCPHNKEFIFRMTDLLTQRRRA